MTLDLDDDTQQALVEACMLFAADTMQEDIAASYISLCDLAPPNLESPFPTPVHWTDNTPTTIPHCMPYVAFESTKPPTKIFAGEKYKPVALKIQLIETKLPSRFWIIREIMGDPLENLP